MDDPVVYEAEVETGPLSNIINGVAYFAIKHIYLEIKEQRGQKSTNLSMSFSAPYGHEAWLAVKMQDDAEVDEEQHFTPETLARQVIDDAMVRVYNVGIRQKGD